MRILFVMRNHGYLRNYASTVGLLASRGHTVIIGSRGREKHMAVDSERYLAELSLTHPKVSVEILPRRHDCWSSLAGSVRSVRDELRYRHPSFRSATQLAARAHEHLVRRAPRVAARGLPRRWTHASAFSALAGAVEAAIPTDPALDAVVSSLAPDVMVATPLVDFNSYQVDYVKTARRLGIPVAMAVASWDNLTNKGVLAVQPDCVIVWNEAQKREAVELHGVPPERVRITGAQLFDDWFERRPATVREIFCRRIGLDPNRPFLLYLCSSLFIARDEVTFVRHWIEGLRNSSSPALRDCGVLVRPHPGHAAQWAEVDLSGFENVTVWPKRGDMPLFEEGKAEYFDSLFHAAAIVAINTTGMIEAGIVGRRSFTLLAPEFAGTQGGTLHFAHLTAPGFLTTAASLEQHHAQVAAELASPSTPATLAPFIEKFVRPFGLQSPATPRVADVVEELGRTTPSPMRTPLNARLLRRALSWWIARDATPTHASPRRRSLGL
jgi:hypothetical protein